MKNLVAITMIMVMGGILVTGFTSDFQNDWPVPEKFKKMPNPVKSDAASLAEGKALWTKHCQSCHGKKGLGDGSKAAQLKTDPGNFSVAAFQSQSDGSLFYKTQIGREDMPNFKKKIPDPNEIWSIVNYMRTFKK